MNCPKCAREMEPGFFYCGSRPIDWVGKERDCIEEVWKADPDKSVRINGLTFTFNGAAEKSPTAYRCPNCRKIIVDY